LGDGSGFGFGFGLGEGPPLLLVALHRAGFGFLVENGYALMQPRTSAASFCWSQALKKSAWMVEAAPEESLTLPEAVGIGK
jgi:hypothetical protein